ncbi:Uncharacterised protein [Streptococcus criceti]|uniref:Uncharacterized protein n=1 Tax=Streptococcus criceti HS-6 TaxID=873449 RepID=G5JTL6_STRCG|nr:hypothetical protein [Streptococcus criceti]EHI74422.1 hypothetical protein STRCR_1113 [Streptococcus criceti HS-6]SUN37688.1 Uncharacterised protein [Streptococcus criceti]
MRKWKIMLSIFVLSFFALSLGLLGFSYFDGIHSQKQFEKEYKDLFKGDWSLVVKNDPYAKDYLESSFTWSKKKLAHELIDIDEYEYDETPRPTKKASIGLSYKARSKEMVFKGDQLASFAKWFDFKKKVFGLKKIVAKVDRFDGQNLYLTLEAKGSWGKTLARRKDLMTKASLDDDYNTGWRLPQDKSKRVKTVKYDQVYQIGKEPTFITFLKDSHYIIYKTTYLYNDDQDYQDDLAEGFQMEMGLYRKTSDGIHIGYGAQSIVGQRDYKNKKLTSKKIRLNTSYDKSKLLKQKSGFWTFPDPESYEWEDTTVHLYRTNRKIPTSIKDLKSFS